jgi:lipoprotein-anchoring transpeptidase ErfK/SrfK
MRRVLHLGSIALLAACGSEGRGEAATGRTDAADVHWADERLTAEELEAGRFDRSWQQVVTLDTAALEDAGANPEELDHIYPERLNEAPMYLPLSGDIGGPSVVRAQVLLDRALFSPGVMDGRWGMNTEKAVYWFQHREGLPATGQLNQATFERLIQAAGNPAQIVVQRRLSDEDVEGPFIRIPDSRYDQANLSCMCYESLREKLGELFHSHPELLERLNPDVELNELSAGDVIWVPNVRDPEARAPGEITRLVISDGGRYLHAQDASGRILYHFPTTLGSSYDPSPSGDFRVVRITEDPWWHYQPAILAGVPDHEPDAKIPPGPNNAVGVVWMALSVPHYGIHGTNRPETIGYASSAGCVRLTNWDALFLSRRVAEGTPVQFRDT